MANKTLVTRVQSKYDTYKNWEQNNPVLLKGEIAITKIEADDSTPVSKPGLYIKVGDGLTHWSDLEFISASAGNVKDWAKADTKPEYNASEIKGLDEKIQELDTDTTYQLIKNPEDEGQLLLQKASKAEPLQWSTVSTISVVDSIKISEDSSAGTNQLQKKEDGLYVPAPKEYTLVKMREAEEGFSATYQLQKDGQKVGESINIIKDFVVKSAELKTATEGEPVGFHEGDKYIDFVINTADEQELGKHIYLNLADLVDPYTAGNGIDISEENQISVKVDSSTGLSVDESGVKLAEATGSTPGAMPATDKAKLDKIDDPEQLLKKDLSNVDSEKLKAAVEASGIEGKSYTAGNGLNLLAEEFSIKLKEEDAGGLKVDENGLYLEEATPSKAGALSAADKEKLGKIDPDTILKNDLSNVDKEGLKDAIAEAGIEGVSYEAGNGINIEGTTISVKVAEEANGLSADATGLKMALASAESAGAMSTEQFTKMSQLKDIATSGDVKDLTQTDGEVLILDCGDSKVAGE